MPLISKNRYMKDSKMRDKCKYFYKKPKNLVIGVLRKVFNAF